MGLVELPIEDAGTATTTIHAVRRADAPLTLPAQRLMESFEHEARVSVRGDGT
jgi:hypothetical protein